MFGVTNLGAWLLFISKIPLSNLDSFIESEAE